MKLVGRAAAPVVLAGALLAGLAGPAAAAAPAHSAPAVAQATVQAPAAAPLSAAGVTESQWLADVRAALAPARAYIEQRTSGAGAAVRPAIVFDIDNTTLQTHFHPFSQPAIGASLELATYAHARGVAVVFITARPDFIESLTRCALQRAGYPVDGLHGRDLDDLFQPVQDFKTAQRAAVEAEGYTIIANVGNNTTDLEGGHADRTFKLPDYNGLLS
ncbi:HAD family acid phosphatase [Streptomyces sp. CB01881]|uniref:HAD family acid phosphatase n=1 Tax=Streptomyces sp. CB01881 TaxID=2078691 RepID=UPI000CDCC105|nr:HAD family acid phosphatase [Streptomyces sp. CB01881]AUY53338.1 hydrolase [Streptomyces sp. CB01881]TYC69491.1 hydrolase [Streptomyces sp. CB01881]